MKKPQTFTELYLPKHEGLERWDLLKEGNRGRALLAFAEAATTVAPTELEEPKGLLELYTGGNYAHLSDDVARRPDHYTDRQKEIVDSLIHKKKLPEPPTEREKTDLLLQLTRSTQSARATKEINRKMTEPKKEEEEIVLEDGKTLKEQASFEKQDFGDKILV